MMQAGDIFRARQRWWKVIRVYEPFYLATCGNYRECFLKTDFSWGSYIGRDWAHEGVMLS